ncbi:DUF1684 domain-containing protein [Mongoliitalea lutea]|uniref:DUF1684 domain-containing protein n=1 Tax=Mongoliitalea lutea TaxID=849756 RepID=A0A8J3CXS2_9BACT|nr:DUF1684 domain-containing protein [Mongoliitalea lutea]GHB41400.1 hypothetical protein GCM10008106_23160 [Mongoliitalea lutea]
MTTRTIITIGVLAVIAIAFVYMLKFVSNDDVYVENIERERDKQYKYLRFNAESPLTEDQKKALGELDFFPIDPSYRIRAKMVPVEDRKMLEIPMTDGSVEKYLKHSYAEFQIQGQQVRLLLLQASRETDKRNFFLAFADATSGESTYGAGRYLNLKQDGKNSITIDFNLAYNPYCAYNPEYACPLPPRENILEIAIEAGEKDYVKG